jgi:hypothetical protein
VFFKLMEEVGTNGKYQKISLAIWCILWICSGCMLLGTEFFMLNEYYNCAGPNEPLNQT